MEFYSMKPLVRYLAIEKVSAQSGVLPGVDGFTIRSAKDKIILMSVSKETQLSLLPAMETKYYKFLEFGVKNKKSGICSMIDRVLQTQLCLVLDPYYEAKYPSYLYNSRKGRNSLQVLGFLKFNIHATETVKKLKCSCNSIA